MVIVLVDAPDNAQPVLLFLDVAPEEISQGPEWIDFEHGQRIPAAAGSPNILETPADCVQGLHQHSFLVPIRPDQLEQARTGQLPPENSYARFRNVDTWV